MARTIPPNKQQDLVTIERASARRLSPVSFIARIPSALIAKLRSRVAIFPLSLPLFFLARVACAQTIWTDASGEWFKPANWSADVPNSSIDAQINNGGTAQIGSAGATTANLYLGFTGDDSGNLLVTGPGAVRNSTLLAVGHAGKGTLTVQNGGAVANVFGNIGDLVGGNGTALIEGSGSTWTTELYFNVGYSGTGMLTIRNGGAVSDRLGFVGWNPGSTGVVLVEGIGSIWNSSGQIQIGSNGTGDLTIRNGGAVSDLVGYIGYGGNGSVVVDGVDSRWTNTDRLVVGEESGGTLSIQNAGAVSSGYGFIGRIKGSRGTVLVDGTDSIWTSSVSLEIAEFGTGSLTIQNGATVVGGSGAIGTDTGSSGSAVVDGSGSKWSSTQTLTVARGTLTIQNGGAVSSNSGFITSGTALIDGVGSIWTTSQFNVGSAAKGSLTIRNGGTLSSGGSYIGSDSGGNGVVLVDGAGSTWNNNGKNVRLQVGFYEPGKLDILHGATVSSFAAGVAVGVGSTGNVTVDGVGSAWSIGTNLYIGGGDFGAGGQPGGTGLLQIFNGGKITSASTTVFGHGTIIDNAALVSEKVSVTSGGLLTGAGSVTGNVMNAGHIKPGDLIGSLTIAGNYTQLSNGTLTIEVTGTDSAASDHLDITGNAAVGGTLEVRFVNGFLPVRGQVFKLLNVGGALTGSFAQVIFPNLRPGFQFSAEFVNGTYQITALNDGVAANGFLNISTRTRVGTGDNALIGGFIVIGNASKKVIIRAIGPSLAVGGSPLAGRLADPTLELRDGAGGLIFSNDNWVDSPQAQQIIDSTVPPSDDHEAAIVATLAPGNYTAIMRGVNNTTGIGVVEVYDLAPNASANLANISSRGFVETGDNVMIGGFIVDNQASQLIVRAIGPSLTQFGLPNALADPTLELHNGDGATIAFNNDWPDTDRAAIEDTGIAPSNNKESAIFTTLAPGSYTAIVRGKNNGTGVALVEVYQVH